ncbi:hypothetical protein Pelo_7894 [Pelomyxa schiedti]|nr:hypothetical protein Pelo_7894 [Pelomyxa schiedti]
MDTVPPPPAPDALVYDWKYVQPVGGKVVIPGHKREDANLILKVSRLLLQWGFIDVCKQARDTETLASVAEVLFPLAPAISKAILLMQRDLLYRTPTRDEVEGRFQGFIVVLVVAAKTGSINFARFIVRKHKIAPGPFREILSSKGNPFAAACKSGNVEFTKWLVNQFKLNLNDAKVGKKNAALFALESGNLELLKWLQTRLQFPHDDVFSKKKKNGFPSCAHNALRVAAKRDDIAVIQFVEQTWSPRESDLLPVDACFMQPGDAKISFSTHPAPTSGMPELPPIQAAVACGSLAAANYLLERYPRSLAGVSPATGCWLCHACKRGTLQSVKWILDNCPLDGSNNTDFYRKNSAHIHTSLIVACSNGKLDIAQWLTSDPRVSHAFSPSYNAGRESSVNFMPDMEMYMAIVGACKSDNVEVASWLCQHFGLGKEFLCGNWNEPLKEAQRCKSSHVLSWLASQFGISPSS